MICVWITNEWQSQKGASLIVVVQQVIDGLISGLILIPNMQGQIHSVDASVQEKRLINVEWETLNEIPTKTISRGHQDFIGNGFHNPFITLSRGIRSNVFVQRKDLLKQVINAFSL